MTWFFAPVLRGPAKFFGGCARRLVASGKAGDAIGVGASGSGSGRAPGVLAGRFRREGESLLKAALRCAARVLGQREVEDLAERGAIEIAPLAFMRGRTLNDACVILDEAQNTSIDQMKMFLTRLGRRGKMVITGDVTQTDLPSNQASGLNHAMKILADVPGIASVVLQQQDVVRHSLVQKIVETYERHAPAPNNKQGV